MASGCLLDQWVDVSMDQELRDREYDAVWEAPAGDEHDECGPPVLQVVACPVFEGEVLTEPVEQDFQYSLDCEHLERRVLSLCKARVVRNLARKRPPKSSYRNHPNSNEGDEAVAA